MISCLVEAYQWNPIVNKLPGSSLFMKARDNQPQVEKRLTGMEKMMKTVSLGIRLIGGTALIGATASTIPPAFADAVPVVGQQAPDFTLPSSVGKEISLTDLKGKRTVLYFYPADFTSGCTLEAQTFERDIAKYKALDAQIVGVSVDSIDKHVGFSKKCGLEFPLLSDSGGITSFKYGSLFDFGFMGKFSNRQTYIISPDLKIEYVFTDVDSHVASHSSEVLSKLRELNQA